MNSVGFLIYTIYKNGVLFYFAFKKTPACWPYYFSWRKLTKRKKKGRNGIDSDNMNSGLALLFFFFCCFYPEVSRVYGGEGCTGIKYSK